MIQKAGRTRETYFLAALFMMRSTINLSLQLPKYRFNGSIGSRRISSFLSRTINEPPDFAGPAWKGKTSTLGRLSEIECVWVLSGGVCIAAETGDGGILGSQCEKGRTQGRWYVGEDSPEELRKLATLLHVASHHPRLVSRNALDRR